MRQDVASGIDCGNRRVMGQRRTEGFGHAGHGRGGAHGVAGACRTGHAAFCCKEVVKADLPGFHLFTELPDHGAGAYVFAFVFAIEHRPTGDDDGRHVATGGAHQQCRGGFIAAGQQHYAINRVPTDRFFDIHARQVAGEHGGRAQVGFAVGKHRELHREAARFDHPTFDVLGDLPEMRVARRQFRPGIADTNDGLAMELMIGDALILHPAAVHKAVFIGSTKPLGRTQGWFFFGIRHGHHSYCKT